MSPREIILRKSFPVVINSFNQPSYLKNIIKKLEINKFSNIIILDNDSKNDELLDFYAFLKETTNYTILYYNKNLGPRYFHFNYLFKILGNIPHLFSDPDIDFNILADDFLCVLLDYSEKYNLFKVGCALEIPSAKEIKPDLFYAPPYLNGEKIPLTKWESQFWENKLEDEVYIAAIDTTLHLFNPKYFTDRTLFISGVRVARKGFIVKHVPWYKDDFIQIDEKDFYKKYDCNWSNY